MPSLKTYQLTVTNFVGTTPCGGYYIYTGLTTNINDADYIYGSATLIPIPLSGYTFFVDVDSSLTNIYLFVEHCDGHNNEDINQGGYQISFVDLRCVSCYSGPIVSPTPSPSLTPTPSGTSILNPTPTPTPTKSPILNPTPSLTPTPSGTSILNPTPTNTVTPTITPTPSISYKSFSLTLCESLCAGICTCVAPYTSTVYTSPNVTSIWNPGVVLYTNSSLTTVLDGVFTSHSGSMYSVSLGYLIIECTIGDGC